MIIRRSIRHEMRGRLFARPRDFFDDAFLVNRQRQRLADARVVERFLRDVEPDEIGAEIIERVKIRALEQHVQQFRRHQFLVPDDVRLAVSRKGSARCAASRPAAGQ